MTPIFKKPPKPEPDPKEVTAAENLLALADAHRAQLPEFYVRCHAMVWDSRDYTPAQVIKAMGNQAAKFLALAQQNVANMMAISEISGLPLSDMIAPEQWMPRLPLIPNEDGTVTVVEVEGLDAWGRPIPPPEPEPEPEVIDDATAQP